MGQTFKNWWRIINKNCKKLAKDLAEKEKSLTETANKLADETKRRETAEEALRVANEKLENSKPKNNVKNNTNKTGFFKKIANWFKNLGNNKMLQVKFPNEVYFLIHYKICLLSKTLKLLFLGQILL